jgi:hypothetical protein
MPPPANKSLATKNRSPIFLFGMLLCPLGGGLAGAFIARQMLEAGAGGAYYEFIAGGAAFAVIGIVIVWNFAARTNEPHA